MPCFRGHVEYFSGTTNLMPVAGKAALPLDSGVRKAQNCIEIHSFRIKT